MISELLQQGSIDLNLGAQTKNEAIEQMSTLLFSSGKVYDHPKFVNAVLERESLGSTAIGAGIAIPHARAADPSPSAATAEKIITVQNAIDYSKAKAK